MSAQSGTGRAVELHAIGRVRPAFTTALAEALSADAPTAPDRAGALVVVLGSLQSGPMDAEHSLAAGADSIGGDLWGAYADLQRLVRAVPERLHRQNVVFVIDGEAALGDESRVGDSTAAGAFVAMGRALALELGRMSSNLSLVFTALIERDPEPPVRHDDATVAARIAAVLDEGVATNGQELFVGGGTQLGRLRP